jgi:hypothetical protein
MSTSAYNKFEDFSEQLIRGVHDFDAHTFKVALTNTIPDAIDTVLADITQISSGGGYTTDGNATTITVAETGGVTTVSGSAITWTGTSGGIATFQYAVLYNATASSKNLIGWFDYGSAVTVGANETFTVKFSNTDPGAIFTLT